MTLDLHRQNLTLAGKWQLLTKRINLRIEDCSGCQPSSSAILVTGCQQYTELQREIDVNCQPFNILQLWIWLAGHDLQDVRKIRLKVGWGSFHQMKMRSVFRNPCVCNQSMSNLFDMFSKMTNSFQSSWEGFWWQMKWCRSGSNRPFILILLKDCKTIHIQGTS